MLDGGVKEGIDAFKALAYGAKLVFFGRPAIWGLAVNGQQGVENVLDIFQTEFTSTMSLTGVTGIEQITRDYVLHENLNSKL